MPSVHGERCDDPLRVTADDRRLISAISCFTSTIAAIKMTRQLVTMNSRGKLRNGFALALAVLVQLPLAGQTDAQRYLEDVEALSAPAMEGRGAGTKGIDRAAHLIEERYKSLGLEPAGTHGYLQPFTVITGAELKGKNTFHVQLGYGHHGARTELKLNQDFVPFSFSASVPEFGYDDYAGLDVKDKIVVLLRNEPSGFAAKSGSPGSPGTGLTQHSQLVTKAINARNHGAKAVVLVNGRLEHGEEDLLTRFGSVSGP